MSKFIDSVKRKTIKDLATSYHPAVHSSSDTFAKAKLGFIVSVSKSIEMSFQSDKPMVPFFLSNLRS